MEVRGLGADRGVGTVAGVHHRVLRGPHVVIVAVGGDHGADLAGPDYVEDRGHVARHVQHHAFGNVAESPHVVSTSKVCPSRENVPDVTA